MSRSHFPELNAILFQLMAELEAYEAHIRVLVREWQVRQDVVLFGEAGKSMDRMRLLAVALPQLSAHWVMVMISHTELMHNLWRCSTRRPSRRRSAPASCARPSTSAPGAPSSPVSSASPSSRC